VEEVEIVNDHGHYDEGAYSDLRGLVDRIVILAEATHCEDAIHECGAADALVLLDVHRDRVAAVVAYDGAWPCVLAVADT
jgi:hypothetical protein